jgi:hypothetical protein
MIAINFQPIEDTLAQAVWDLRRDCQLMDDKDVAYDLGYIMALCMALGRKRLAGRVLDRFEQYAY